MVLVYGMAMNDFATELAVTLSKYGSQSFPGACPSTKSAGSRAVPDFTKAALVEVA